MVVLYIAGSYQACFQVLAGLTSARTRRHAPTLHYVREAPLEEHDCDAYDFEDYHEQHYVRGLVKLNEDVLAYLVVYLDLYHHLREVIVVDNVWHAFSRVEINRRFK